ncbi:MAG: glycine dehydrogenase (aminomethyl-transferring) [Deltaproteobacteria bacterium RBG_13_61_14]|nr:MAG: glycine dehydrogenase (aminomethyl-transferring) [Deltaproteobacteria bacterium RBG_13_61_14]
MNPPGKRTGLIWDEPLLFELHPDQAPEPTLGARVPSPARSAQSAQPSTIPSALLRETPPRIPDLSEPEVLRHYSRLSSWNYGVDQGFYPLGSCTMKHNPRLNEAVAALPGFAFIHPEQPADQVQGALRLMHELARALAEISGMDAVSLQPAAGAHGELCGMLMIRAYHQARGDARRKVLIPDTAHGTNPASSALAGYEVVEVPTGPDGLLHPDTVAEFMDESVAGLMLTNPNTLGLFESYIAEVAEAVHKKGGLVYGDGANLNALMGIARPGDMGIDVIQFNLHKTFSTPHGGGGPGAGPVGVKKHLEPYLPVPIITERQGRYDYDWDRPQSIGKVGQYYGNFGVMVRAGAYIRRLGGQGLAEASRLAILNANYLRVKLRDHFHLPHPDACLHECVFSDKGLPSEVTTLDLAKRLMDYGFHPPTIYFPLVVHGALMVEPTESESKETLDQFIEAMVQISREARENPDLLQSAPQRTPVGRLDEVRAARKPILRWQP